MMRTGTISSEKLSAVSDLIRLPRQQGTLLVLWPTLWSLFLASDGRPPLKVLVIFVIGTFLMRSAGCAINDVADRGFDPFVERTRSRPIASGRLCVREALFVFAALSLLAFVLVLFLNPFTIVLSFIGIALASVYPFVKRVSHWPQAVLGMAFGWGAVMAWAAVNNALGIVPLLIFAANIFWSIAYDTIYALMDKDDDIKIGVKSTALLFGDSVYKALYLLYVCMAIALSLAGYLKGMGAFFFGGVFVSLIAFIRSVNTVKRTPTRATAWRSFTANAFFGGLVLVFILIDFYI
ncbi:MAG TPA: 4-hydroxybenzoate octaprenyltransferase [Deltaproteobacteria bacterium]|nr:4-hydroxybenzoate octaprenyltransferase [Deltaproteobacteria bacterium]